MEEVLWSTARLQSGFLLCNKNHWRGNGQASLKALLPVNRHRRKSKLCPNKQTCLSKAIEKDLSPVLKEKKKKKKRGGPILRMVKHFIFCSTQFMKAQEAERRYMGTSCLHLGCRQVCLDTNCPFCCSRSNKICQRRTASAKDKEEFSAEGVTEKLFDDRLLGSLQP